MLRAPPTASPTSKIAAAESVRNNSIAEPQSQCQDCSVDFGAKCLENSNGAKYKDINHMRIRLRTFLATLVAALGGYFIELSKSFPLGEGVLIVVVIGGMTYLISEHLIPLLERWWDRRHHDGQPVFRMEGMWWEIQSTHAHIKIAAVSVKYNTETERISLDGIAFDDDGTETAFFRSLASVFLPERREVFYQWEGNLRSEPKSIMKGVGTMAFNAVNHGPFREGMGDYVELATGTRPMFLIQCSLVRFSEMEEKEWESNKPNIRKRVVLERLAERSSKHSTKP